MSKLRVSVMDTGLCSSGPPCPVLCLKQMQLHAVTFCGMWSKMYLLHNGIFIEGALSHKSQETCLQLLEPRSVVWGTCLSLSFLAGRGRWLAYISISPTVGALILYFERKYSVLSGV